jgi:1-deoxy-D-xylulose-5-phosphate reductoisomerase
VTWPQRVPNTLRPLNFAELAKLEFDAPRVADFPALNLARRAGEVGGALPAILNAANEVAVQAFLERKLSFPGIWETVERVMEMHRPAVAPLSLSDIVEADSWARTMANEMIQRNKRRQSA